MSAADIMLRLVLDLLVAGLLTTTIVYCLKLNRRIRVLQDSKSELAQLIAKFDESTQQATRSINEIHAVSKKIADGIKARIEKANYIADDLAFMIEKGNKLADKMSGEISQNPAPRAPAPQAAQNVAASGRRAAASATTEEAPPAQSASTRRAALAARNSSREVVEDIAASKEQFMEEVRQKAAQRGQDTGGMAATAGLEQMLNKMGQGKSELKSGQSARKVRAGARLRSKAEQELYDALKPDRSS